MSLAKESSKPPARKDGRIILHFDYDCFYASVFEAENPALKNVPLAVQQKQIIVTCNYEARRRGLYKLQLVKEAKQICPDVVVVLGEDLTRFRNASKVLYAFLSRFSWSNKAERLGFDEVWLDCTELVDYNFQLLTQHDLSFSFFHLSKDDPTVGFLYDASIFADHVYPASINGACHYVDAHDELSLRLCLGSHLGLQISRDLEHRTGYTSTVGVSTSKLLSKLVGNVNKPKAQTTLVPPYTASTGNDNNVTAFLDSHEIGKIPNIGFKSAQRLREYILGRPADFHAGLVYGKTQENVTVRDVRLHPEMGPTLLDDVLGGPGIPHGIGPRTWGLINGIDDTEVNQVKQTPSQISIEDSYIQLDTLEEATKQLQLLSVSLIKRMHLDLLEDDEVSFHPQNIPEDTLHHRWIAYPRTLRLSTRPRPALNPDWTRSRAFNRISRSAPVPSFLFNLNESAEALADKLVHEAWLPLLRKLHPEKSGWNLSLVNVAVTNMAVTASDRKSASGRDIGKMFKIQDEVLREWRVEDVDTSSDESPNDSIHSASADGSKPAEGETLGGHIGDAGDAADGEGWEDDEDDIPLTGSACQICGVIMPAFAMLAHQRYHLLGD